MFLQLNVFILNLKKFQLINAEATIKILKQRAIRTSLPLSRLSTFCCSTSLSSPSLTLLRQLCSDFSLVPNAGSLPRMLVQAIGETLLPVIPHVDDYSCLFCTSIAFKPIRLACGHLFCVRCLVKMQKRGAGNCPLCRAPTVIAADRSNVDWAMLNFMQDWFPLEIKAKVRENEREVADEQLQELGIDPRDCAIM